MLVSSNLASQSSPQGSLLKASCGVSVAELRITATILSESGFFMVGGPSSESRNHSIVSRQLNARIPKVNYLTYKNFIHVKFLSFTIYIFLMKKDFISFHTKTQREVLKLLNTSEKGLSSEEAEKRLREFGKNEIKKTHKLRPVKIFLEQFKSFLIYILILAIIISALIGNLTDVIVISAIVIINASIGFFQQYKAEKAISKLKKFFIPKSIVIRDNKHIVIPSSEIVPGDILVLNVGDRINADCRILEQRNLQVNEAALTGESLPVVKTSKVLSEKTSLFERTNMLYMGTEVVAGSGKGIVVATGMNTEFGKIAFELQEIQFQKTPMQKRLDVFSKQLGLIILGMVLVVMLLGFLERFDKVEMFLTAVALAVGSIPEGLPAVLAISFAISSLALSKQNVIIRKLPAVESLGSVTVICSDKTGTITEEKMFVKEIFSNNKTYEKKEKNIFLKNKKIDIKKNKELSLLIKTSLLCNNARYEKLESGDYSFIGDPTEESFIRMALDLGISKKELTEREPRIKEFEFDSQRKMMSILRNIGRSKVLYSKGASEKILNKCSFEIVNNQIKRLTPKRKKILLEESFKMEKKALRVLAFAYKNFAKKERVEEKGLIFLGFIGIIDPPRAEVKKAIKQCMEAGIKVKMITGDSVLTAKAIANQIGLKGKIITGDELDRVSEQELSKKINDIVIFARTTPQQKLKITKILQSRGETVAITGDGINDILALKAADIGIAMGKRGTDVARDTADIILADDNFASIVLGVKEGRRTYDNVKKFIKYMLSINFDSMLLIAVTLFMGLPLPLIPIQILWMNLITDSFPALTMVFEKSEKVMQTPPRREKSILSKIWKFILVGGLLNFTACFIVYLIAMNNGLAIEKIRAMVLTTGILFELFFIYTCRSSKPLTEIGIFSNKWLNYAIIFSLFMQFVLLYTGLSGIFRVSPLSLKEWIFILPFAVSGLIIFEISKYIKHKKQ